MWWILLFIVLIYLVLYFVVRPLASKGLAPKMTMKTPSENPKFDNSFRFGASTAAWQIEDIKEKSNWSLFEEKGRCPPHEKACDGIKMFDSDLKMMKDMGLKFYRFSVSWTAINPEKGKFDLFYLENYINICKKLKEAGIEPMLTLCHFEHPAWVEKEGGVLAPDFKRYLCEITATVVDACKEYCTYYITINEPAVFANNAYKDGIFPPGEKSFVKFLQACDVFMECHASMYKIIHEKIPNAMVSIAKHMIPFYPMHEWSVLETVLAAVFNNFNTAILDSFDTGVIKYSFLGFTIHSHEVDGLKNSIDFIGINHYYCTWISFNPLDWGGSVFTQPPMSQNPRRFSLSDFGWSLAPESLSVCARWVNERWNARKLPIIITEHGIADKSDKNRQWFLPHSLSHLRDAIDDGINVTGYCHWSLLDNYEWAEGYKMRFGLIEVDFETQERKLRDSAIIYKNIISDSNK